MTCDRCGRDGLSGSMSTFNRDMICPPCEDAERRHPDYEYALSRETAQVIAGNYNYPGVGWPGHEGRCRRN